MPEVILKSQRPYSPGLEGIVAGLSQISEIDPKTEHLTYRGYDIHDLTEYSTYEEVAFLLFWGRLPKKKELEEFSKTLVENRDIPKAILEAFKQFPSSAHPMDMLRTSASLLSMFDPEQGDHSHDANIRKAVRLVAKFPSLISAAFRIAQGKKWQLADTKSSHAKAFLSMITGKEPDDYAVHVFDQTLIIYAEHGFNASTFSARVTASTLSDLYAGVTSAVGTLKGSLHGGANEQAMKMLLEVGDGEHAKIWIKEALSGKKRVMGFGHREYKNGDPRARILKPLMKKLGERVGQTQWYQICDVIEEVMVREKKLYPNVDFPAGALLYMLGLPTEIYTPVFALSRVAGWSAHVIEQLDNNRLIRPECEYTGARDLKYVPIEKR